MANTALDILVEKLFDYSGMFPPASKSLSETLKDGAEFQTTLTRPEMVNSDIVLPISHLQEVTEEALINAGYDKAKTILISLLGSEFSSIDDRLESELKILKQCNNVEQRSPRCKLSSYEIKVGTFESFTETCLEKHIGSFSDAIPTLAIEPDLSGDNWRDSLARSLGFITKHRQRVTLKFRGTGATGIGNERIAFVIAAACDAKINLKATGGLHHPFLEERYQNNLGFLGMSSAIYLRYALGEEFTIDDIMGCLCACDPTEMDFETVLSWRDKRIELPALRELKARYSFCIGSCSLQEPDQDLIRIFG